MRAAKKTPPCSVELFPNRHNSTAKSAANQRGASRWDRRRTFFRKLFSRQGRIASSHTRPSGACRNGDTMLGELRWYRKWHNGLWSRHRKKTPGTRHARSGPLAARAIAHAQMARAARRHRATFRSEYVGLSCNWIRRAASAPHVGRILASADDGGHRRYALRHALEPLRRALGRRRIHRSAAADFAEARREIRDGRSRARLHLERPARRPAASYHPFRAGEGWGTTARRAWLPRASGSAAPLRLEKR